MSPKSHALRPQARHTMQWFNSASDLRCAAAAVWTSVDPEIERIILKRTRLPEGTSFEIATRPVFLLLAGLSLEVLYKGILVATKRAPPASHDLLRLAREAAVPLSRDDTGALQVLTAFIAWRGRYPVPLTVEEQEQFKQLHHKHLIRKVPLGKSHILVPRQALDWERFLSMWETAAHTFFRHVPRLATPHGSA